MSDFTSPTDTFPITAARPDVAKEDARGYSSRRYGYGVPAFLLFAVCLTTILVPAVKGQTQPVAEATQAGPPLNEHVAVTYPEGRSVEVPFRATGRLPSATGQAKIRRRLGITEIDLKLEGMRAAFSFGGDFNTYVVWALSPEGISFNVGELVIDDDEAELKTTTLLTNFSMLVTAEPHFLVQEPSGLIIAKNTDAGLDKERKNGVITTRFQYDIRTDYKYEQATLAAQTETSGEVRTWRFQAIIALRFAEQAGAPQYAPKEYAAAQAAMSESQKAFGQRVEERQQALLDHRAIRLAVEARRLALEREAAQSLAAERQKNKETVEQLTRGKEAAESGAFLAGEEAKSERAQSEKLRAQLQAAEKEILLANQDADRLAGLRREAEEKAEDARREAAAMYSRLQGALSRVADTRETDRGLIVNLPDILFDSGKSTLRGGSREVLSQIAGILLVAPEFHLSVEGHTDSTGRTAANQRLSEERAVSVLEYLVKSSISPSLMSARGFGETKPVASNNSAQGRQQNRRVEIVVEGLTP